MQATVAGQPGASRGAKAGIVIRNEATGSGPEGVLLYVSAGSSSSTVQMAWNTGTGADITNTSASSPAVSDPVTLRQVGSVTNGSTYTGYYSTNDGSTWIQPGPAVDLSSSAAQAATQDAGMFQASGSTTPAEADFSDLTVS